jgi:hypothetical protein
MQLHLFGWSDTESGHRELVFGCTDEPGSEKKQMQHCFVLLAGYMEVWLSLACGGKSFISQNPKLENYHI